MTGTSAALYGAAVFFYKPKIFIKTVLTYACVYDKIIIASDERKSAYCRKALYVIQKESK